MKRVAFIALGLLLFAGGVLAGRFSVREPVRERETEYEVLERLCLIAWAEAYLDNRPHRDDDLAPCRAFHALYPRTRP
jgi:hypothetical protein